MEEDIVIVNVTLPLSAEVYNIPGVATTQSPDMVNGIILINTFYMYEKDYHVMMMVARKDTRYLVTYQTIYITKGAPPKAGIL